MSKDLGDLTVWARACCGLGDLALHHNDYAQALDIFTSAAEAAHRIGSTPEEAQALLGLGRVTSLMGDAQLSRCGWNARSPCSDSWAIGGALRTC